MSSLKPFSGPQSKSYSSSSFFDNTQLLGAAHFPSRDQTRRTLKGLSVPRSRPASFRKGPEPGDPEQRQPGDCGRGKEREFIAVL